MIDFDNVREDGGEMHPFSQKMYTEMTDECKQVFDKHRSLRKKRILLKMHHLVSKEALRIKNGDPAE